MLSEKLQLQISNNIKSAQQEVEALRVKVTDELVYMSETLIQLKQDIENSRLGDDSLIRLNRTLNMRAFEDVRDMFQHMVWLEDYVEVLSSLIKLDD